VFDNTSDRIYGVKEPQPMVSESYFIGKSSNPADNLAKVGRKTKNQEREVSFRNNSYLNIADLRESDGGI